MLRCDDDGGGGVSTLLLSILFFQALRVTRPGRSSGVFALTSRSLLPAAAALLARPSPPRLDVVGVSCAYSNASRYFAALLRARDDLR